MGALKRKKAVDIVSNRFEDEESQTMVEKIKEAEEENKFLVEKTKKMTKEMTNFEGNYMLSATETTEAVKSGMVKDLSLRTEEEEEIIELSEKIEEFKKEKQQFQELLTTAAKEKEALIAKNTEQENAIATLEEENEILVQKTRKITKDLTNCEGNYMLTVTDVTEAVKSGMVRDLDSLRTEEEEEIMELNVKIENIMEENKKLSERCSLMEEENEKLYQKTRAMTTQLTNCEGNYMLQVQEKTETVKSGLIREQDKVSDELDIDEAMMKIKQQEQEIEDLRECIGALKIELSTNKKEIYDSKERDDD